MKHSLQFFLTTALSITSTVSIAMELEQPQKKDLQIKKAYILTAITNITNPEHAHYLTNNEIIVAGENGCSVIDPTNNKEIQKISDARYPCLAVHPDQKQFAVAYDNKIDIYDTIYDAKNYPLAYSIPVNGPSENKLKDYEIIKSMTFSPHDTSILLIKDYYSLDKFNFLYLTSFLVEQYNHATENKIQFSHRFNQTYPIISCNPIDNEICMVYKDDLYFYNSNLKDVPIKRNHRANNRKFHQYTPNGKLFAINTYDTVTISNDEYKQGLTSFESLPKLTLQDTADHYRCLEDILFYSNSVLATLVGMHQKKPDPTTQFPFHGALYYWDIHTKETIYEEELPAIATGFSFNPGKTNAIITLKSKVVIIIPVHFNARYKDITEETLLYLLFALKNICIKSEAIQIPDDIILFITSTIHETYKRD